MGVGRWKLRMVVWRVLEGGRDARELPVVVLGVEGGGGRRADGVEELVDGGALVVDVGVVEVVHGGGRASATGVGRRVARGGARERKEGGRKDVRKAWAVRESERGMAWAGPTLRQFSPSRTLPFGKAHQSHTPLWPR